jgi:hypothetical protein
MDMTIFHQTRERTKFKCAGLFWYHAMGYGVTENSEVLRGPSSFSIIFYLKKINNQFVSFDMKKSKIHNEPKHIPSLVATLPRAIISTNMVYKNLETGGGGGGGGFFLLG